MNGWSSRGLALCMLWANSSFPVPVSPMIVMICIAGAFSVDDSMFDIWIMIGAGAVAYFLKKNDYPVPPILFSRLNHRTRVPIIFSQACIQTAKHRLQNS